MSDTAQDGYVALATQAGKGVPAASFTEAMKVTDNGLSGRSGVDYGDAEIGGGRTTDSSRPMLTGYNASGSIEGYLRSRAFPLLLMGAGLTPSAPTQEGATGAFSHPFATGLFTWLSAETSWGKGRAVRRFSDVLVNSLDVSLDAPGRATFTADLLGLSEAWQGATSAVTFETDPIADWLGSAITFDTLGTYRFETFTFSLANNLDDDEWVIGTRSQDDATAHSQEVTFGGRIKLGANSPSLTDLYRAAMYGSKTATAPSPDGPYHTSGSAVIGHRKFIGTSVATRFGHTIACSDLVLEAFPLEGSGDDRLNVEITARAVSSTPFTWTVRNGRSTLYA